MKGPYKRKVTLLLPDAVVRDMKGEVSSGRAASQGSLVAEAVTEYLATARRVERDRAYSEAAHDPEFLADVETVMRDFAEADEELPDE